MRRFTARLAGLAIAATLLGASPALEADKAADKPASIEPVSEKPAKTKTPGAPAQQAATSAGTGDANPAGGGRSPDTGGNAPAQVEAQSIPAFGTDLGASEMDAQLPSAPVVPDDKWLWTAIIALAAVQGSSILYFAWQVMKLRSEIEEVKRRARPKRDMMPQVQDDIHQIDERVSEIEMKMPQILAGRLAQSGTAPTRPCTQPQVTRPDEPAEPARRNIPNASGWAPPPQQRDPAPAQAPLAASSGLVRAEQVAIQAVTNALDPDEFEARLRQLGDLRNAVERGGQIYVSDRYAEDPSAEIVAVVLDGGASIVLPSSDYIRIFGGNSNVHSAPGAIRAGFELAATGESQLGLEQVAQGRLAADGCLIDFRKGRLRGFSG